MIRQFLITDYFNRIGQMQTLAVGSTRFGLEFDRYLQGTREVNAIRVVLRGGLLLQAPTNDGSNEPGGDGLLTDVE